MGASGFGLRAGATCVIAWDLRGDVSAECSSGLANWIHDYDVLDTRGRLGRAPREQLGFRDRGTQRVAHDGLERERVGGRRILRAGGSDLRVSRCVQLSVVQQRPSRRGVS
jgi:hypothetical protein